MEVVRQKWQFHHRKCHLGNKDLARLTILEILTKINVEVILEVILEDLVLEAMVVEAMEVEAMGVEAMGVEDTKVMEETRTNTGEYKVLVGKGIRKYNTGINPFFIML